ncbi:unnamed protein product [Dovyalis caffra]|uniref:Uncharacterized protein n=2 Tax=Magnoliopsida TaxID=3398 RepID=A0AAV1S8H3_9ROSI|nr:unnamed protein product [Dovyalis caffra]
MQSMDRASEKIAYGAGVAVGTVGVAAGVVCGTKMAFDWVIDRYDEFETRSIERIMRKIDANRKYRNKGVSVSSRGMLTESKSDVIIFHCCIHNSSLLMQKQSNDCAIDTCQGKDRFKRNSLRINAIATKWEPTKVVPQADRVLIRLEDLPEKSSGGVLLPKSAVKFERYLMGEVLSVGAEVGAEVGEVEAGKKVLFSDINAYEVNSVTIGETCISPIEFGTDAKHCFCKAGDLLAIVE